ncbi:helix-turn-helix domain-containing protein [Streptomyces sp. NPDC002676]
MGLDHASLTSLAVLGDATRRRMFEFTRQARRPVSREEVAEDLGISRKLAAFHLDKLVTAGLLRTCCESPAGTVKVGRRPKLYEPVTVAIGVTIPERRYGMPADVLTEAVLTETDDESAHDAALRVAHQRGEALGTAERERVRPGASAPSAD